MRQLITKLLCIGILTAGSLITASAQSTTAPSTPAAAQPAKALRHAPFRGTIGSVDKTAKTITMLGGKHQVIAITSQTKITKNGQAATFEDLVANLKVTGSKKETALDKWEASSLKIVEAPTPIPTPAPGK